MDGTVIKEKPETNADFYGGKITSEHILRGGVVPQEGADKWPMAATRLTEILKLGEGKTADSKVLHEISVEPTPGDLHE